MHARLPIIAVLALSAVFVLSGVRVAAAAPDYEGYVVRENQTLADIAAEYGLSADDLARYNSLAAGADVRAGQIILVPINLEPGPSVSQPPAPVTTGTAPSPQGAAASAPAANQVKGTVGIVSVQGTDVYCQPRRGALLFQDLARGTELLVVGQSDRFYALLMADGSTGWVDKSAVSLTERQVTVARPEPPPARQTGRTDMVQTAFEYLGIPYKYGGRLPDNVDCSLLVQTVFARHGIRLPRTAAQQFGVGTPVEVDDLQAGDRVYFRDRNGTIGHTGIYIGDGRFIHASSNRRAVAVDELGDSTYWRKYAGARR